uniref:Uncharacterized protein n=1 Tax=viral metagenome TaxID=1070528 RepID=A0A6M3LB64_9ZZZZ
MCNHVFRYPEDKRENYNSDGETLTGVCKYCGKQERAYGLRWVIRMEENFLWQDPCWEFDNSNIMC